ncbi:hypothetical protein DIURU_004364 [Diutina rugosa]|uniref:Probable NADPH dehydrogenase n=1 Tax=Diutina rugosa TaxID=5481 RepID=A0A642UI07_DIURU|nr:uncharacterized protein DIURU_004364 [Diutina rugosa]KAA8899342.1 hypothetical protein DIURU_004364 [Diutina rugosa]
MTKEQPRPLGDTKLFKPIEVGAHTLENRVVYAPTTRFRALANHVPSDLQVQYYDDRSKTPGSLLITEATFVSPQAGGYPNIPGIWNAEQSKAWKVVTDKVHANKSFMSVQLWNLGRAAFPKVLKEEGQDYVSASQVYDTEERKKAAEEAGNPLRPLTTEEVDNLIEEVYPNAAKQAMDAGFDYVELHSAHGYLLDQFLQPTTNKRTDKYGGSIENRARLVLSLVDKLGEQIGYEKVGIRISPWAQFEGMKGKDAEINPIATFGYLLSELQRRANDGKKLAYVSIVDPRVSGIEDQTVDFASESNDFVPLIWKGTIIKAGNYTYDSPKFTSLIKDIENDRTLIGFARYYTSNPDLVERLRKGEELTPYKRDLFYANSNWGYNTFDKYGDNTQFDEEKEKEHLPKPIKH